MRKRFINSRPLKRICAVAMAAALTVGMFQGTGVKAAEKESKGAAFKMEAAITNLEADMGSAPPMIAEQVKGPFKKALGDTAIVEVKADGSKSAIVTTKEMSIMGIAVNISNIKEGTVLSEKTNASGTQVPDQVSIPLTDNSGTYALHVNVDFMGSVNITATLSLDLSAVLEKETLENKRVEAKAELEKLNSLKEENYTPESWKKAWNMINAMKQLADSKDATLKDLETVITGCKVGIPQILVPVGNVDFTELLNALNSVPNDLSQYTDESAKKVSDAKETAQKLYDAGADTVNQEEVNAAAEALKMAIADLQYKDADYSKVDEALSKIPADLSKYTDETVKAVNDAKAAVKRGLKINEQEKVDKMASAIRNAVNGLKEKETVDDTKKPQTDTGKVDKNNLSDGIYEVPVWLWHATNNAPSMAADSVNSTARIVVKGGKATMYIYTKQMTMGNITASLQEMKVEGNNGNYTSAKVESKDANGNPTCFSFALPHKNEYIKVKVNPHVAIMGNQDIDARIRVDYTGLKLVSKDAEDTNVNVKEPAKGSVYGASNAPKTADGMDMSIPLVTLLAAGAVLVALVKKRQVGLR